MYIFFLLNYTVCPCQFLIVGFSYGGKPMKWRKEQVRLYFYRLNSCFYLLEGSYRLQSYAICRMKPTSKLAWMMYIISYFNFRARENNISILLSPRLVHDNYSTTAFLTLYLEEIFSSTHLTFSG